MGYVWSFRAWGLFLLLSLISFESFAADKAVQDTIAVVGQTTNIRSHIKECAVFLTLADTKDDSIGLTLASYGEITENDATLLTEKPSQFGANLRNLLANRQLSDFKDSTFYITGVPMGREKEVRSAYENAIIQSGLPKDHFNIRVLSVPKKKLAEATLNLVSAAWQRFINFWPNRGDYQKPDWGEIKAGIATTVAVEALNVYWIATSAPPLEAATTLTVHAATLLAYTVWIKSMVNWLMRSPNHVELFMKQMLLSFPFILNFNVFGNLSKIMEFYQAYGWSATLAAFPAEMANFVSTQGLTMFLQTVFYSTVITKGIRGWVDSQSNEADGKTARAASLWVAGLFQAPDAVILYLASTNWWPLFHWDLLNMNVNGGHALLAALTAVGSVIVFNPSLINPAIPIYRGTAWAIKKVGEFFGIDKVLGYFRSKKPEEDLQEPK